MTLTAPAEYDYEVEGGDCLYLAVNLKDGNSVALDLGGYSSTFSLVWAAGSLTLYSGNRLEMFESGESPQADGSITGELTGAETDALPYGRIAKYEWSVTEPSGCRITFLKGYIVRT